MQPRRDRERRHAKPRERGLRGCERGEHAQHVETVGHRFAHADDAAAAEGDSGPAHAAKGRQAGRNGKQEQVVITEYGDRCRSEPTNITQNGEGIRPAIDEIPYEPETILRRIESNRLLAYRAERCCSSEVIAVQAN